MRLDVPFDLDFTLCCGQTFRWTKVEGWWVGIVNDKVCKIRQVGNELEFVNVSEAFVVDYFALNDNLDAIGKTIGKDPHIKKALKKFEGLRILRQDPWECLISYICATFKSIPAIKHMLNNISQKYGNKLCFEGQDFFAFPSLNQLANASEKGLRECGLGYRAKYVHATARKIRDENINLSDFKSLPYLDAKKRLLEFPGVGFKVADCVLLFSLGKTEAFPIDVWIKRVLLKRYSHCFSAEFVKKLGSHESLSNGEYLRLSGFGRAYFGCFAGYAQEYLFHFERTQT